MQVLFEQNEKIQGIPNKFLLDKKEFGLLLLEVQLAHKAKTEIPITFNSKTDNNVHHSIQLEIYRTVFSNESINEMINRWIRGAYEVTFRGVPIKYRAPDKKGTKEDWNK